MEQFRFGISLCLLPVNMAIAMQCVSVNFLFPQPLRSAANDPFGGEGGAPTVVHADDFRSKAA